MFSKTHILYLGIILSNCIIINATTATARVSLCTRRTTKNKIIMPGTNSYKREMRKICVAFGIQQKLDPSPLVRVRITQNDRKKIPKSLAQLSYLPFTAFAHADKRDWITPYGKIHSYTAHQNCLEVRDSGSIKYATALSKAAKLILRKERFKDQRRDAQQKMLDHFTRMNAQREARLIAIAKAESKKMAEKEEAAVDDDKLPTDEAQQFLEEDTGSEEPKASIAQSAESGQRVSAGPSRRSSIEARLSAPLMAQSDDDDHVDHVDESGYSTEELFD